MQIAKSDAATAYFSSLFCHANHIRARQSAVTLFFLTVFPCWAEQSLNTWQKLDQGLDYAEFKSVLFPSSWDSCVSVLRIDSRNYKFKYLVASEIDSTSLPLSEWAKKYALTAVINAGMYAKDYLTHVGYSKNSGRVHNSRVLKTYKSVLAFDPEKTGLPEVRLMDLECEPFSSFKNKYRTLIQNIRMISCNRKNVWSQQPDKWSTAALGQDSTGRILFIFSRSPYSVHDFIEILLRLPIAISRAMYLEGGSPAGLYVTSGSIVIDKSGLEEDTEPADSRFPQALPNVIGIVKKRENSSD
jgi:hypothetical protein